MSRLKLSDFICAYFISAGETDAVIYIFQLHTNLRKYVHFELKLENQCLKGFS